MAFKMKGMDFGNSPITKKAGPETKKFNIDNNVDPFSDEETAYENAQNDYDTDNPTKAQLAKALAKVKAEKKR
tara:strand:- start:126 stop:344 length:219 start_codon:yes stop_codon:yes gene_type:complete